MEWSGKGIVKYLVVYFILALISFPEIIHGPNT